MTTLRHGHGKRTKKSPTYSTWSMMKHRCSCPSYDRYSYYGGRGITVCERWQIFENFLEDMGERPAGATLDRIDTNKGYSKDNCRWATKAQQQSNRRNCVFVTINGKTQTIKAWAEELGVPYKRVMGRKKRNWPIEKLFEKENHGTGRRVMPFRRAVVQQGGA